MMKKILIIAIISLTSMVSFTKVPSIDMTNIKRTVMFKKAYEDSHNTTTKEQTSNEPMSLLIGICFIVGIVALPIVCGLIGDRRKTKTPFN